MSAEMDFVTIEAAVEQCATCTKAMFPTYVFDEEFKKKYTPLIKEGKITQEKYDEMYNQQFDAMISKGSLYFCNKCDNLLYKKSEK